VAMLQVSHCKLLDGTVLKDDGKPVLSQAVTCVAEIPRLWVCLKLISGQTHIIICAGG
jgi:hypothetical protein